MLTLTGFTLEFEARFVATSHAYCHHLSLCLIAAVVATTQPTPFAHRTQTSIAHRPASSTPRLRILAASYTTPTPTPDAAKDPPRLHHRPDTCHPA